MVKKNQQEMIVGLDIGTSKIMAIVAEVTEDNALKVVGVGTHPSRGLKKGVVVDIESTVQSIQRAIEEAELMADCTVYSVFVGIAGSHIQSLNSHGMIAIRDKSEVSFADVDAVIDAARAVATPADQKVLHALPQEFIIDQQEGIKQPVGMAGIRLDAKIHLVTAAESAMQNIEKCVRRCGLDVDAIILEQLASSYAVLTDDEKELGVCLIDIGGGTTDIAIFTDGAIRHTAVIPIAGYQVTNDIAVVLRTPTSDAEEIKIKFACAHQQLVKQDETIDIPGVGGKETRRISRQILASVVQPRYEELLELVSKELERSGFLELLGAGVVLTGGSSRLEGLTELAEEVFHKPVRIGKPRKVRGLSEMVDNPTCSTGVGLLIYGHNHHKGWMEKERHKGGSTFMARFKRLLSHF